MNVAIQPISEVSEIGLVYRTRVKPAIKITGSKSAYRCFIDGWDQDLIELQEQFKVMLLNRNHMVLGIYSVYVLSWP